MGALAALRNWSGAVNSDEELIAEVLAGQTAAFSELSSRHRGKVERLCQRFFNDQEIVRDLAQESLIRAFTRLGNVSRGDAFWRMAACDNGERMLRRIAAAAAAARGSGRRF